MNRFAASFSIKILASFASFLCLALVLASGLGLVLMSENASYQAESFSQSGQYQTMVNDHMHGLVEYQIRELDGDAAGSFALPANLFYVLLIDGKDLTTNIISANEITTTEAAVKTLQDISANHLVHEKGNSTSNENINGGQVSYEYFAAADLSFPYTDAFSEASQSYALLKPLLDLSLYIIIPASLILVLLLAYLIRSSGMLAGKVEVRLNFLDRCWADLLTGLVFTALALYLSLIFSHSYGYGFTDLPYIFFQLAAIGLPVYFLLLAWFLSICRRIRAGQLLHNTFVNWLYRLISSGIRILLARIAHVQSGPATAVVFAAGFGGFLLFNGLLAILAIQASPVFFLFALAFDLAVMLYLGNLALNFGIITRAAAEIAGGNLAAKADTHQISGLLQQHAKVVNRIGDGLNAAIAERMKSERFRTELIANVSHDIKTPLTSIINYVDLLKKQLPVDEKSLEYLAVLERNSQRLKELTDDLLDFSKFSTGNIELQLETLDINELIRQGIGEYVEKLDGRGLRVILNLPAEPVYVQADGRQIWRILENLLSNISKYALRDSRVYVDLVDFPESAAWTLKNISDHPLNISADVLLERFVRGDASRNTEGSGLGLSIAKSLTELQGGEFTITIDGDLFKIKISLPKASLPAAG